MSQNTSDGELSLNETLSNGQAALQLLSTPQHVNTTSNTYKWGRALVLALNFLANSASGATRVYKKAAFDMMVVTAKMATDTFVPQEIPDGDVLLKQIVSGLQALISYPKRTDENPFESFLRDVDYDTSQLARNFSEQLSRLLPPTN